MSNQFATPPPFAGGSTEEVQQTEAPTAQQEAPQQAPVKEKKKRAAPITEEQIKYVRDNVKKMGYGEMADALGISRNQVNRILQELKKGMRAAAIQKAEADGQVAYGTNEKGRWDYSDPKTELAKKIEQKIENDLSRPAESRPGAGRKGGGSVQNTLQSEVDELLKDL
ncbi:MAG: helix-turn-helix domain-containing protein [bacterium]